MCFFSDKMENTRNHFPKLIVLNEFQLIRVPVIIWYFKESLRHFSHTKKRLWTKACGNWFMLANFSFKTVFWVLHVSVLEEKEVVMFLPVSLWHFVSPLHSERRGAFWIVWNCHYHCGSAEKEGRNHRLFMKEIQAVHTHTISETRGCCKQNSEVLWKADSCHPSLSRQHALARPDPATSVELCPVLGIGCGQREVLSWLWYGTLPHCSSPGQVTRLSKMAQKNKM